MAEQVIPMFYERDASGIPRRWVKMIRRAMHEAGKPKVAAVLFSQFRFRMKTERTLRQREAHYRLLANNIADIIILIDARSLIRYVSQSVEPVLGLRPEDLLGKSCFDMIHPEDRESVRPATARLSGIDLPGVEVEDRRAPLVAVSAQDCGNHCGARSLAAFSVASIRSRSTFASGCASSLRVI